jgi:hypothetical protein
MPKTTHDEPEPIFCGECTECGWTGPPVATIEEAMRDADAHTHEALPARKLEEM